MPYLLAGPFVALVGIVAVFFVLRRKSVEKRSMYSARRSQIEHKVRAARQRTMTPRGRGKPAEQTIPAAEQSPFATTATGQTMAVYDTAAYQAPPAAPTAPSPFAQPEPAPSAAPWDTPAAAPAPAAPSFDYPPAQPPEPAYTPPQPEPYQPAPAAPSEPVWTPAPEPAAPAQQLEPAPQQTAAGAAAGAWSVVTTEKESAATVAPDAKSKNKKQKGKDDATGSSWELASGMAPGAEQDEPEVRRSNATLMAIAQYAVLVVGLVMVLIGVIVMVANSHVT